MFANKVEEQKTGFLDKAKAARSERATEKQKEHAAILIQAIVRRFLVRCRLHREIRKEVDAFLKMPEDPDLEYKPTLKPALDLFRIIRKFMLVFRENEDQKRFEYLCKYILLGMNQDNTKLCYVSVSLMKGQVLPWIKQLKDVLWQACLYFRVLKPNSSRDMKLITTSLSLLITFTSCSAWRICKGKSGESMKPGLNQLCNNVMGHLHTKGMYPILQILLMRGLARSKPVFKQTTMSAIITLSLRPLLAADFSDNLLSLFLLHILSVPALVHHIRILAEECLVTLMTHRIFRRSIGLLSNDQHTKIIFNVLEGNYALCLLANLIELGNSELEGLVENTNQFMYVVTKLLECCQKYVLSKRSNLTHWHPVLGWFSQPTDEGLHEAMPQVVRQLQILWSLKMIRLLFEQLFVYNEVQPVNPAKPTLPQSKNIFKKAMEKASSSSASSKNASTGKVRLDSVLVTSTCMACHLYHTAMATLSQLKLDILAGLSFQDVLLPMLWRLVTDLGPQCGLKAFMDTFTATPNDTSHPIFGLLHLGCEIASHIITILDDVELYEQHKPFSPENLVAISNFLNYFIFRIIWNAHMNVKTAMSNEVFCSSHSLLMILYERDCRRSYTPKDHWLIRDVKPSAFISELEKGKKPATFLLQNVPHIIPHKDRVLLFRRNVVKEKEALGLTETASASPQSTLITVQRSRIIEDGYRQLALLPPNAFKGLIRVKFVNEQGLDEAGIDQDGVFKEFLEETISRVFDPSLNLFKVL